VREHDGDADDLLECTAGLLEDGGDVGQTLTRLLLNRRAPDLTRGWIIWRGPRHEDQPRGLDRLTVRGRRLGGFRGEHDLTRHVISLAGACTAGRSAPMPRWAPAGWNMSDGGEGSRAIRCAAPPAR